MNDSVCWSWKVVHAVVYNTCWPCNVPLRGHLDLGVRIRVRCGAASFFIASMDGFETAAGVFWGVSPPHLQTK